jgi:phospholysine phosphohistidine inorganic pyrophosphate phosphatase
MIRGILFDLDGVLYNHNRVIPGAVEALAWVRAQAIPHLLVTNTSSRSRAALVEKLGSFGMSATEAEIFTPSAVAAQWLRANGRGEIALFLKPSTRAEFAGLPVLPDDAERGASYVVIGDLQEMWDYRTLNRAFRLLHHNPEARLIALGMTRYWLASDGLALDVAPFVAALEHATGRKPLVFGKPAAAFFAGAAERLGLPADEILMIGDDITADVGGAQAAGLKGLLVETGKFRPADLDGEVRPYAVLDSVADLPRWWKTA